MTAIDDAREWARVARQKFDHYEQNVAPNWLANPTAVSVHEQGLVRTVPHLVEQIEALLAELDRRQVVVDAAIEWRDSDDVQLVGLDDEGMALADEVDAYRASGQKRQDITQFHGADCGHRVGAVAGCTGSRCTR